MILGNFPIYLFTYKLVIAKLYFLLLFAIQKRMRKLCVLNDILILSQKLFTIHSTEINV